VNEEYNFSKAKVGIILFRYNVAVKAKKWASNDKQEKSKKPIFSRLH
jgi:hypothetical protein